ncbi:protein-L-isoaspartate(D-aspartate) O-methyltransferase [Methanonatronarchaeum sp. AMET-Sl]|uniref:protein-L-isoaspartate(D-aspartate) O-methyltransferase n=1 Tax=Methanonatronarchaeum sp. AMET-Sl TaxID=3037654 RepID=UPI00244DD53E|nr:protein-L-isoaspartate(D-aspartate) O-methyltransferase [Methanonatronarchaeum sp. AMET-Sl]WGI16753.1 protein-L-isoaspartate(D-aspartate) O-methyltransferase [Methanonatronarchaeum sp. AMET-Sl]
MSMEKRRDRLVDRLVDKGFIADEDVERALRTVPRHKFVPENRRESAYYDRPLPIGENQTISAPHMVGILVEKLELDGDEVVLEIGGGSGYNAAVIAELLDGGEVVSIERIEKLAEKARNNLEKTGYGDKVTVVVGDGSKGYSEEAPYNRILLTAGAPELPKPLVDQLIDGGIIVAPVGDMRSQTLIVGKKRGNELIREEWGRCAFVPLIGKHGFKE